MLRTLSILAMLAFGGALQAQSPPVTYSPPSGSNVQGGGTINVQNNTPDWMTVEINVNGEPTGEPILIPPGGNTDIQIPDGMPIGTEFELDPSTEDDPLDGW